MPQRVILVYDVCGLGGGDGDDAYLDALLADGVREVCHGLDYEAAYALAYLALVGVKGCHYFEAFRGEAGVADDGGGRGGLRLRRPCSTRGPSWRMSWSSARR